MSQGHSVSIGGNRLGSGNKMKAYLHNYERSTHDLSYVFRTTQACGTLVPFMSMVALPGDTFDIDLDVDVLTQPTIGPLFGSYKVQLDVFSIPVRLYQAKLHMNMLGIGRDMSTVALPQVQLLANVPDINKPLDNRQINPSCIFKYLGISGVGYGEYNTGITPIRNFNGVPWLAYWDIYKNYYANKQEEIGAVIHRDTNPYDPEITLVYGREYTDDDNMQQPGPTLVPALGDPSRVMGPVENETTWEIQATNLTGRFNPTDFMVIMQRGATPGNIWEIPGDVLFKVWSINPDAGIAVGSIPDMAAWANFHNNDGQNEIIRWEYNSTTNQDDNGDTEPSISTFPLSNIDECRTNILQWGFDAPFIINNQVLAPYQLALDGAQQGDDTFLYSKTFSQEGLALKTYQSDLFNNWISTDWIDGPDGISEITKVSTAGDSFTIDELNLSKKIYDMLNRIAISGGSYDDWLDAVYTHDRTKSAENPMYMGGLIRNVVFQEVVSNSATAEQPLGTLAGRGRMGAKKKGGKIIVKTDEPSYIMGIVSLTPNIDYSQGNTWDVNLATMNDFHKPALDAIGFQDLITDQMAWWDTFLGSGTQFATPVFKSAGKQPAWINYMTNISKVYGNFADQTQQMFMVLNRRYTPSYDTVTPAVTLSIKDLTTYIDPVKFNHIFADTRRDAQNFWVQIGCDIEARRKMSAKVMPNL